MKKMSMLLVLFAWTLANAGQEGINQTEILKTWYPYSPAHCWQVKANHTVGYGKTLSLRIVDQEVIEQFRAKFPYDDCYQGVCNYYQETTSNHLIINFTKKLENGHWGRGQAGEYTTVATDNGTWIGITNDQGESFSWLWKGCY